MFGSHLKDVRDLMELKRYQTRFKHKQRSVAEHSWFVTKIAHGLALWERDKFGAEVDVEKVLFLALNHDIIEVYTGDIISTTKNLSKTFHDELEQIEGKIFEQSILPTVPASWRPSYMSVHTELSSRSSVESKLVKAGDLIDRVFECIEEIELQNKKPFEDILVEDLRSLYALRLKAVDYFLKYSIKDIGAYSYIPFNIRQELECMDFSMYF